MTLSLRTLFLCSALGLTLGSAAHADVTLRYLASHGGLSAHELAKELGYYDGTGITLENLGYASGGPESLIALANAESVELVALMLSKLPVEAALRKAGLLPAAAGLHTYRTDADALVALQQLPPRVTPL